MEDQPKVDEMESEHEFKADIAEDVDKLIEMLTKARKDGRLKGLYAAFIMAPEGGPTSFKCPNPDCDEEHEVLVAGSHVLASDGFAAPLHKFVKETRNEAFMPALIRELAEQVAAKKGEQPEGEPPPVAGVH